MQINWAKYDYYNREHHKRYVRHVEAMPKPLICQSCGGAGGETEVIDWWIGGPWVECGWCEGTGYVTPHRRGEWLRCMKAEKRTDGGS